MPAVAAGVNMGNLESPMWYGYTKPDGKCSVRISPESAQPQVLSSTS